MWDKSKKDAVDLVFIYDDLLDNNLQTKLKLPLEFVSLGYIEGYKLYHYRKSTVAFQEGYTHRKWGNDRVYGAVYRLPKTTGYLALLDAFYYYLPSQKSNKHNLRLRRVEDVNLFNITTLNELLTYRFKPYRTCKCILYVANLNDERFIRHIKSKRYRIVEGIDKANYNTLLKNIHIL